MATSTFLSGRGMGYTTLLLGSNDIVGESIVYDERRNALLWVDIVGKRVHRLSLDGMRHETWPTPEFPTSIGLRKDGGAIVGLTTRVSLWDFKGNFETLAVPEPDFPDNRLNEGRVAPDGSFWVGTMQNNLNPDGSPKEITRNSGAIYRVAPDGLVQQLTPREYGISNTMAWTDDHHFLFADTLQNTIFRFDTDGTALKNRHVYFGPFDRGSPDGSCLDGEGQLWNCRVVGGASVACISKRGQLRALVELPCSWPTSCTFGGRDFDRLFVTSARFSMTSEHLEKYPLEGGLFEVKTYSKGKPEHRFGA
jgi:sugar lactone lactonase YvrE